MNYKDFLAISAVYFIGVVAGWFACVQFYHLP